MANHLSLIEQKTREIIARFLARSSNTSNQTELFIRSSEPTIAKFLSTSDDAYIMLINDASNITSNILYFGNDTIEDELYIGCGNVQKLAAFGVNSITLNSDAIIHSNVLPTSNNMYDIKGWNNIYIQNSNLYLNTALISGNTNSIELINSENNSYLEVNASQIKLIRSDGKYAILGINPLSEASVISTYSSNGSLIKEFNIGQLNTSMFQEDATSGNLYFNAERVANIIQIEGSTFQSSNEFILLVNDTSNSLLHTTDYAAQVSVNALQNASNDLITFTSGSKQDANISNYIDNTSNEVISALIEASNSIMLLAKNTDMYHNISNYIDNTSNMLLNSIVYSNDIVTSNILDVYTNASNNVRTLKTLSDIITNNSNVLISKFTTDNDYLQSHIACNLTSNSISDLIDILKASIMSSSNEIIEYQNAASNIIAISISSQTVESVNVSNYVHATSNHIINMLNDTSNIIMQATSNISLDTIKLGTSNQVIIDNIYDGDLTVSNLTVIGNMVPSSHLEFNLGSDAFKWGDIFLSGNSIHLADTIISVDPSTNGIAIKDKNDQLVEIVTSQIKIIDTVTGNFTALKSENNSIQISSYASTGNEEIATKDKSTDEVFEGTSNLYFKYHIAGEIIAASNVFSSNYASNIGREVGIKLQTLSADQIANGIGNEFIVNGVYNTKQELLINAKLTASNLNISGASTKINTAVYETENLEIRSQAMDGPSLKVIQQGNQNVVEIYSNLSKIFSIADTGYIGIGNTVATEKLDVIGGIRFSGSINSVSSNSFSHLSGVNRSIQQQLTTGSVNISNYIVQTSNQLHSNLNSMINTLQQRTYSADSNTSNYMITTSNMHASNLRVTSNAFVTQIRSLDTNMSNYITSTSNLVASALLVTSNIINQTIIDSAKYTSNYIENYSNVVTNNIRSTSNYIAGKVNSYTRTGWIASGANIYNNSNIAIGSSNNASEKLDVTGSIQFTGKINNTSSNELVYVKGLRSNVQAQLTGLLGASNLIRDTSNQFASNIMNTSNIIVNRINTLDVGMSNFIRTSSNTLWSNLALTSNQIALRLKTTGSTNEWANVTSIGTANNSIYLNKNVGIGTSIVNNRLDVYGGNVNISRGGIKKKTVGIGSGITATNLLPSVWYQFNEDPSSNQILYDSNIVTGGVKYDMTVMNFLNDTSNLVAWWKFDDDGIPLDTLTQTLTSTNSAYKCINSIPNSPFGDLELVQYAYAPRSGSGEGIIRNSTNKVRGTSSIQVISSTGSVSYGNALLSVQSAKIRNNTNIYTTTGTNAGMTYAFWIKINSIGWYSRYFYHDEFGISIAGVSSPSAFGIFVNNNASSRQKQELTIPSSSISTMTNWEHWVITLGPPDASQYVQFNLYKNGSSTATITYSFIWSSTLNNIASKFGIGGYTPDGLSGGNQMYDDFRIYNKVLSASEISLLYSYNNILTKFTGYTTNSYLYQNAYLWNGSTSISTDNAYLTYTGSSNNIQTLLNTFDANKGFTMHFLFKTANITSTSEMIYFGNSSTDIIRVNKVNSTLNFALGDRVATASFANIKANTTYVTALVCSTNTITSTANMYLNSILVSSSTGSNCVHPTITMGGVSQTSSWISGNDYYYAFTSNALGNTGTITFGQSTACDILMIGAGGGGGFSVGDAGGAGACIVSLGYTFAAGTYTISVGAGGTGSTTGTGNTAGNGTRGGDSTITTSGSTVLFRAKGGGAGDNNSLDEA
jgi:hypothetical protein